MAEFLAAPNLLRYAFFQYPALARTVTDGATTSASTTVTSATANFTSLDVGASISGGSIPGGATISSVTNATTVVISSSVGITTASGVTLTITRTGANGISGFQTVYQAGISALASVQAVAGTVIGGSASSALIITPGNGPVVAVAPGQYLGFNFGTYQVLSASQIGRVVTDAVTTSSSTTVTSATASFAAGDVGAVIATANLPVGTTIASVTNSTTVVVSAAATASGSSQSATITPITALFTPDVV